jgi:hypothetical protein
LLILVKTHIAAALNMNTIATAIAQNAPLMAAAAFS